MISVSSNQSPIRNYDLALGTKIKLPPPSPPLPNKGRLPAPPPAAVGMTCAACSEPSPIPPLYGPAAAADIPSFGEPLPESAAPEEP